MNLAEAYFVFASRQSGRGFGGRTDVLPIELKLGKLNMWPVFATAFAANTGLLDNLNSETVTPTDLAAIVRAGFISAGSRNEDAEVLLVKALEVLRAVRTTTAEAYGKARPPVPDIDAASIAADCDDTPNRRGPRRKRERNQDRDDQTTSA